MGQQLSLRRVALLLLGLFVCMLVVSLIDWLFMRLIIARSIPNPVYP